MELQDLKKQVDLEAVILASGFNRSKEKSTRKKRVYNKGAEELIVQDGYDCKTYWVRGNPERGTIVDFLKNRPELIAHCKGSHVFERIKNYLSAFSNIQGLNNQEQANEVNFKLTADNYIIPEEKDINTNFSYFRERGINQMTINSPVFENIGLSKIIPTVKDEHGNIIPAKYHFFNVAFPMYNADGEIKSIDYRFNKDEKSKKRFIPGSEKRNSIWISSDKREGVRELILNENPVDSLSHYQLHRSGKEDILYCAFEGTITTNQLVCFLKLLNELKKYNKDICINLGFDNDLDKNLTGQAYCTAVMCSIHTNTPISVSYESGERFSFLIPQSFADSFNALTDIEGISLTIASDKINFSFPKDKNIIEQVNNHLSKSMPITTIISHSLTKDWNEDLVLKNSIAERNNKNLSPDIKTGKLKI